MKDRHTREMRPFLHERAEMVQFQRDERKHLKAKQEERWIAETKARQDRLNRGLRGLFDRITGAHRKTKRENEREAFDCLRRDQQQRDRLIEAQMRERKDLQLRMNKTRLKHQQERKYMAQSFKTYLKKLRLPPVRRRSQSRDQGLSR